MEIPKRSGQSPDTNFPRVHNTAPEKHHIGKKDALSEKDSRYIGKTPECIVKFAAFQ
jgi:hypothetical protein